MLAAQPSGAMLDLDVLELDVDSFDDSSILVRFSPEHRVASSILQSCWRRALARYNHSGASRSCPWPSQNSSRLCCRVLAPRLRLIGTTRWSCMPSPISECESPTSIPNDVQFGDMWPLDNTGQTGGAADADIDAPAAWEVTHGSSSMVVAVIDTGVDYAHPDLAGNMWVNVDEVAGDGIDNDGNGFVDDVHGYDFINGDGDPMDDQGHGTHVAGTIGAVGNNGLGVTGINWDVQIMALKFLGADGSGSGSDAIEAIRYAVDNGAVISNNSWGGDPYSQAMHDAIAEARDQQHIFVAAAGNGNAFGVGIDNDATPFYPSGYDLDNVISVAAVDHNDDLGSFSNFGATSVDLAAPGVNILSTTMGGGYGLNTGTSMASPHAAGVTSLVWDLHPDWSYQDVIAQVLGSVDPLPELYGVTVTGGRLNAATAVGNPEPPLPPSPPGTLPINEDFSDATADYFRPQTGNWSVQGNRYHATPVAQNHDLMAITTLALEDGLPENLEIEATVNADEGRLELFGIVLSDHLTNGFVVFDYHSPDDFKFAGPDMKNDQWVIGNHDSNGWHTDAFAVESLDAATDYEIQVRIENNTDITLLADGIEKVVYQSPTSVTDGELGLGMRDSTTHFDDVTVRELKLPEVGPRVLSSTPAILSIADVVSDIRFEFDEPVDATSFTVEDVAVVAGPELPVEIVAVTPVPGSNDLKFDVSLSTPSQSGDYRLELGPDILDLLGNPMDQDEDSVNGEASDFYAADFRAVPFAARYDFGPDGSPVADSYVGVGPADSYSASAGYGWQSSSLDSRDRVDGSDLTRDLVFSDDFTFATDLPSATYDVTVTLGDTAPWPHDQMAVYLEGTQVDLVDTQGGEVKTITYTDIDISDGQLTVRLEDQGGTDANVMVNGLEIIWISDTAGPRVLAAEPSGIEVAETVDRFTFTFDEPILDGSFTVADVTELLGPTGPIVATSVNQLSTTEYEVVFPVQSDVGDYSVTIGPDVYDHSGNPMNQDLDELNGELFDDSYTTEFQLIPFAARYDFGTTTSPVAVGYTGVDSTDTYDSSAGYGWIVSPVDGRDRGDGTDMTRDLVYGSELEFAVDVPPTGAYDVTLSLGDMDRWAHDDMAVYLEGTLVDLVDTAGREVKTITYAGIAVDDGQLTVRLEDQGGSDVNVMVNGLEINWVPDTSGPRVIASDPIDTIVAETVDRVALTFSEAILDGSFTLADVTDVTGPTGSLVPTAVNQLSPNAYEVVFPAQNDVGGYSVTVGPDIYDRSGNAMNQDGDGLNGESDDDSFTTSFQLIPFAARYDFGTTTSPVALGYTGVDSSDTYDSSAGYGWIVAPVDGRDRGDGTDMTRDLVYGSELEFAVDVPSGAYDVTLSLGDMDRWAHDDMAVYLEGTQVDLVDTAGREVKTITYSGIAVDDGQLTVRLQDQGGSDVNVMVNGLEINWVPDTSGPLVVASDPIDTIVAESVDRVTLTFSEAILDGSFTLADVTDVTGPSGSITATAVNQLNAKMFEVVFPAQSAVGNYSVTIGPGIHDLAGNAMDQNGDGINGEPGVDEFVASFGLVSFATRFDFGTATSPVEVGYTGVDSTDAYDSSAGYGWIVSPVDGRDRGAGTDMTRDLVYGSELEFAVDVPNGFYDVSLSLGDMDRWAHDDMAVFLEGTQVDLVDTAGREVKTILYSGILVDDGQLTVRLEDQGGVDVNVMVNGLEITAVAGSNGMLAATANAILETDALLAGDMDSDSEISHDWSGSIIDDHLVAQLAASLIR